MSKILDKPIPLYKGEDRTLGFQWSRAGVAFPVTGFTFTADIKDEVGGSVLFTLSSPTDFTITDGPAGEFTMTFLKTHLDGLTVPNTSGSVFPFRNLVMDIEALDGTTPIKVLYAQIQLYDEVTTSG